MSVKLQVFLRKTKKNIVKKWYQMMTPLARYLYKKYDEREENKTCRITEHEGSKWLAQDMVKYIIKYNSNMYLIIADYIDREDFSGCECLGSYWSISGSMIKRKKTKRVNRKFKMTIEFQSKVLDEIGKIKGVTVEELNEDYGWRVNSIKNYQGTYKISIEGSKE